VCIPFALASGRSLNALAGNLGRKYDVGIGNMKNLKVCPGQCFYSLGFYVRQKAILETKRRLVSRMLVLERLVLKATGMKLVQMPIGCMQHDFKE
jgi:hypothetical protein